MTKDVYFTCSDCRRRFAIHGMKDEEIGPVSPEMIGLIGYDVRCPICRSPNPELLAILDSESRPIRNLNPGDTLDVTVPDGQGVLLRIHTRKAP